MVGVEAMTAGIELGLWFEGQARRVYSEFEETAEERDRRQACEWIAKRGGESTQRDFQRFGPGKLRGRLEELLRALVKANFLKL
jgi:hypothetical protein